MVRHQGVDPFGPEEARTRSIGCTGAEVQQLGMFAYVSVEDRVPKDHPIRKLRTLVDVILGGLDEVFEARYAPDGRISIPPERLLRAALTSGVSR